VSAKEALSLLASMTFAELFVSLLLSLLSVTGLFTLFREARLVLRAPIRVHNRDAIERLLERARVNVVLGGVVALVALGFLVSSQEAPRIVWLSVGFVLLHSAWLQLPRKRRSAGLRGSPAPWVRQRRRRTAYEGYDDSWKRMPASSSREAQRLYGRGQEEEKRSRYDSAIGLYEQAIRTDPEFAKCHVALGVLQFMRGERKLGEAAFREAEVHCPESAFVLHVLARLAAQAGRSDEAKQYEAKAAQRLLAERAQDSLALR
jgi:tetratricopeptide (TPR) repeat protein